VSDLVRSVANTAPEVSGAATPPLLDQLADIALPPPVAWTPQTVGWAVLGGMLLLCLAVLAVRGFLRYRANRYRRDALAELARLQQTLAADAAAAPTVLVALPAVLKRTALAAWPRERVAGLNGAQWAQFLRDNAGAATQAADRLGPLVQAAQYRGEKTLSQLPREEAQALLHAGQLWIEGHRVPA
jgi:hypothetical protein